MEWIWSQFNFFWIIFFTQILKRQHPNRLWTFPGFRSPTLHFHPDKFPNCFLLCKSTKQKSLKIIDDQTSRLYLNDVGAFENKEFLTKCLPKLKFHSYLPEKCTGYYRPVQRAAWLASCNWLECSLRLEASISFLWNLVQPKECF